MTIDAASGYEVRQGRTRTMLHVAMFSVLPTTFMVVGLLNWSDAYPFFVFGLLFELIFCAISFDRIRRAVRQERLFAIDAEGVFLGSDDTDRPSMREPWSRIDFVVHFHASVSMGDSTYKVRHVGVVRGGKIVNLRAVRGWTFDLERATAATVRFGRGTPLLEAPFQRRVPDEWFVTIPLPQDWLAANT